jgi:general secretion pathway protein I
MPVCLYSQSKVRSGHFYSDPKYSQPVRSRGFTLVEVMVALAIVAIALPAVLMSLYQQIDDTAYLRDKTMAQMVAANKLAEMRLVIASTRVLTAGKDSGVTAMAERDWYWWMETKPNNEQLPKFFRTEIRVALAEEQQARPLYTLTAFMSSDLQVDTAVPGGPGEEGETPPDDGTESDTGDGTETGSGENAIPELVIPAELQQEITPDGV